MVADGPEPDTYLVVMDGTPECRRALRYAALRAARTGGRLRLLHVIEPPQFVQWGAIQNDMEAEAQEEAQLILAEAARQAELLLGAAPETAIRHGRTMDEVLALTLEEGDVRALVLAAAVKGRPGPLVEFFSGEKAAQLPCILTIIPGGLSDRLLEQLA
jgi:nucleotide-binding universal stress UspA family protein